MVIILEEFAVFKCIAKQFGDKCEVVLHDFSEGREGFIIEISRVRNKVFLAKDTIIS